MFLEKSHVRRLILKKTYFYKIKNSIFANILYYGGKDEFILVIEKSSVLEP